MPADRWGRDSAKLTEPTMRDLQRHVGMKMDGGKQVPDADVETGIQTDMDTGRTMGVETGVQTQVAGTGGRDGWQGRGCGGESKEKRNRCRTQVTVLPPTSRCLTPGPFDGQV